MNARVRLHVSGGQCFNPPIVERGNPARTGLTKAVTLSCADILPVCVGGRCGGRRSLVVLTRSTAVGGKEGLWLKCHLSHDFIHFSHEYSGTSGTSPPYPPPPASVRLVANPNLDPFMEVTAPGWVFKMDNSTSDSQPIMMCEVLVSCQTGPPGVDCFFAREGGFLRARGGFLRKPPCAITELPLDLAPPTERARPRGLQQTWLAAPGAHATALAAPLRLPPRALRSLHPPRGNPPLLWRPD
jgi:hypothetical protein